MILDSIIIENLRSYSHEEIEFSRGITLFEGDIGSGKSTVLMAIEFALFGLGSQKPESLLAKKASDGYVILDFTVDGTKYEIKRILKRKASRVNQDSKNSYIKVGNEKELLSPSELKQKVLQILRFKEPADPKAESRIFRYAIFTPQEEMKKVLADSKTRLETIRKAFGIEDYNTAINNAKEVASDIKLHLAELQGKFANILELENIIKESKKLISEIDIKIAGLEGQKKQLTGQKSLKENEIKELLEKNKEKAVLKAKKESIENNRTSTKSEIKKTEQEIQDTNDEIIQINEKLAQLNKIKKPTEKSILQIEKEIQKYNKIKTELIQLKSQEQQLSLDIDRIIKQVGKKRSVKDLELLNLQVKSEITGLKTKFEKTEINIERLNKSKIENQTKKQSLEDEINNMEKLGTKCPTCKQNIPHEHVDYFTKSRKDNLKKINSEIQKITDLFFEAKSESTLLVNKIKELEEKNHNIENMIPYLIQLQEKSEELVKIKAKIDNLEAQNATSEAGTKEPLSYLTSQKDELIRYQNSVSQKEQIIESKIKSQKLLEKYHKELENYNLEIKKLDSQISEISKRIESFENLDYIITRKQKENNEISENIHQILSRLAAIKQNIENEKSRISESEEKIKESKRYQIEYNKYGEFHSWIGEFFIKAMSEIEKQVLISILQNFNETYHRWYSILVEDVTKESRIDENFTPIIEQDGFEQEIGYLSGGEKTSIALAYRLTLNSLMRQETDSMRTNLLILDEPTDGFSKSQLSKVQTILQELNSEQIILVSHEKELETYVDSIFRVTKEDGLSHVSRFNR